MGREGGHAAKLTHPFPLFTVALSVADVSAWEPQPLACLHEVALSSEEFDQSSGLRSCVKVEVVVLGSLTLISLRFLWT